jgi:hypothetical protein
LAQPDFSLVFVMIIFDLHDCWFDPRAGSLPAGPACHGPHMCCNNLATANLLPTTFTNTKLPVIKVRIRSRVDSGQWRVNQSQSG